MNKHGNPTNIECQLGKVSNEEKLQTLEKCFYFKIYVIFSRYIILYLKYILFIKHILMYYMAKYMSISANRYNILFKCLKVYL